MATLKGTGFNTSNARNSTGATGDDVNFGVKLNAGLAAGLGFEVTSDAKIGGNLQVLGDIQSTSTSQLLVSDEFIELNVGNSADAAQPVGYTGQLNRFTGFAINDVVVPGFTTAVANSSGASTLTMDMAAIPVNAELISFTAPALAGGVTQTINFVSGSATETAFSGNSANIRIAGGTPSNNTPLLASNIAVLLNTINKQQGLTTYSSAVVGGTLATGATIDVSDFASIVEDTTEITITLANGTTQVLSCVTVVNDTATEFRKGASNTDCAINIGNVINTNTNFTRTSITGTPATLVTYATTANGKILTAPNLSAGAGITLVNFSSLGSSTVTFASAIGLCVQANITFVQIGGKITGTSGDANGVLAKVKHDADGGTFATGDIMCISGATDLNNNGLYLVAANVVDAADAETFICPAGNISDNIRFCQSGFDTSNETSADLYKIDLYVQIIASGSAAIKDGAGTIAKGTLADHYASNATIGSFDIYSVIGAGAVTLQNAYDTGQVINVSTADLVFNTESGGSGDFLVAGAGDFTVTTTGAFDVGTSGNTAITLGGSGAKSIDSTGNLTTTGTGNVAFTNTGDVGMSGTGTLSFANTGTQTFSGVGAFDVGTTGDAPITLGGTGVKSIVSTGGLTTSGTGNIAFTSSGTFDVGSTGDADITLGGTGAKSIVSTGGLTTSGTGNIAFTSTGTFNVGSTGDANITLGGTGTKTVSGLGTVSIATTDTTANALAITADSGSAIISAKDLSIDLATATEGATAKYAITTLLNDADSAVIPAGSIVKIIAGISASGSFDCVQTNFVNSTFASAADGITVNDNTAIVENTTVIRINLPGNNPLISGFVDFSCVSGAAGANQFNKGGSASITQGNITAAVTANANFSAIEGSTNIKTDVTYLGNINLGVTGNAKTIVKQSGEAGTPFTFAAFSGAIGTNVQIQNTASQVVTFNYFGSQDIAGQAIASITSDAAVATASVAVIGGHSNFTAVVNGGDDNQVDVSQATSGAIGNTKTIVTNTAGAVTAISAFAGGITKSMATAKADNLSNSRVFGVVDVAIADAAIGTVYGTNSVITGDSSKGYNFPENQIGEVVYLSAGNLGGVTTTPPATSTQIVYEVGVVLSNNQIMFRPNFVMIIG